MKADDKKFLIESLWTLRGSYIGTERQDQKDAWNTLIDWLNDYQYHKNTIYISWPDDREILSFEEYCSDREILVLGSSIDDYLKAWEQHNEEYLIHCKSNGIPPQNYPETGIFII